MDVVLELLKLGSVGVIAGLFASVLSNRDHRYQKWWELRVAAYQNAIEALSDLLDYYDKHYNAAIEYRELPEDFQKKLQRRWEDAYPRVRKYADSGAFLFSDEANAALQAFIRDDEADSYVDHLDARTAQAKKCLGVLVQCSKTDLNLRTGWIERIIFGKA